QNINQYKYDHTQMNNQINQNQYYKIQNTEDTIGVDQTPSNNNYTKSTNSKEEMSQSTARNNQSRRAINDYEFIEIPGKKSILGQGAYGTVRLAIDKNNNYKYAIKIMQKQMIFQYCTIENLKREIKIQKNMSHENICKLFHYFEDKQNVYLVLEFCEQGSLFNILKRSHKFPEEVAFRFFYQTCLGIDHLHRNSIIHRDLKPENLLVDSKGDIKLCDFGWSAEQRNSVIRNTFCGTVDYMAPEMIENVPHDHRIDIWCLGILLYELIHGYAPFSGDTDNAKLNNIKNNQQIKFSSHVGKDLEDLICQILKRNPLQRLSMKQIFYHQWMQKFYNKIGININEIMITQGQNTLYSSKQDKDLNKTQDYNKYIKRRESQNNDYLNSSYNHNIYNFNASNSQQQGKQYYRFDADKIKYNEQDEQQDQNLRKSQISNDLMQLKNNKNLNIKKDEESFFDRIFIAFGCVSRDKNKKIDIIQYLLLILY
ncbi:protein kinase domain protein, partial [Ichthyophthirius multifiliis]